MIIFSIFSQHQRLSKEVSLNRADSSSEFLMIIVISFNNFAL